MYLKDVDRKGVDWINLAQDKGKWQALVNMIQRRKFLDWLRSLSLSIS